MSKKKNKNKPQNKYAKFSHVEENPKLIKFEVSKQERIEAEKSYRQAMRLLNKFNEDKNDSGRKGHKNTS